jgi:hypothetical protein
MFSNGKEVLFGHSHPHRQGTAGKRRLSIGDRHLTMETLEERSLLSVSLGRCPSALASLTSAAALVSSPVKAPTTATNVAAATQYCVSILPPAPATGQSQTTNGPAGMPGPGGQGQPGTASIQTGTAVSVQVKALDAQGHPVSTYTGTAAVTCSDTTVTLPASITFTNGVATFQVTFTTAGTDTLTVTDSSNTSITGKTTVKVVTPAVTTQYGVSILPPAPATGQSSTTQSQTAKGPSGMPGPGGQGQPGQGQPGTASVQTGTAVTVQVMALDALGHPVSNYSGTATVTCSDTTVTLPASITFVNGVATFQVTFTTAGADTLTVTDSSNSSITGKTTVKVVTASTGGGGGSGGGGGGGSGGSGSTTQTSSNWSGYAAETSLTNPQSGAVTSVTGTWTVPTVTGSAGTTAYSSVWVGIDGFSSSTVEQIGTDSDIVNGVAQYYVWYETYPSASVTVTSMAISPGDTITASVIYVTSGTHAGQFELTITDTSKTNDSFTIYQTVANAKRSSAEWVVEAPSSESGILPLANFGSVTITGASATINGTTGAIDSSNWQAAKINMAAGSVVEASTSAVTDSSGTSSFTVAYQSSGSTKTGNSTSRSQHRAGLRQTTMAAADATGNAANREAMIRAMAFASLKSDSGKWSDWL